jgi:HPr kinase/phosphorylase
MTDTPMTDTADTRLAATCVAIGEAGLLIRGPSGAGKSRLALELIALGAVLVADDVVTLRRAGAALIAAAPATTAGLIEARGIGLLRLPHRGTARLTTVLDIVQDNGPRLPARRTETFLQLSLQALTQPAPPSAAAVLLAVRHGPPLDPDREDAAP